MKSTWVFCFFLASFWGRFCSAKDSADWEELPDVETKGAAVSRREGMAYRMNKSTYIIIPNTCEEGWILNGDECFWISKDKLNYNAALHKCNEMGSHLAKIENARLWSFIKQYLDDTTWIGFTDRQRRSYFRPFHKRDAEEPNSNWNDVEDCLALRKDRLYYYNDEQCQWSNMYVCQKGAKNKKVKCPDEFFYSEGLCYHISTVKGNWTEGSKYCNNKGGTYAKVVTKQQLDIVDGEAQDNTWIGLNDLNKEGTYVWESDGSIAYTNWCDGDLYHVDRTLDDCVYFNNFKKCWTDRRCTEKVKFLCETNQEQGECPDGFDKFQNSCYFISTEKSTWHSGKEYCENMGAYLAKMSTAEENEFIGEKVTENMWFGLSNLKGEGNFIWTKDNKNLFGGVFANKAPKDDLDCIHLWKTRSYIVYVERCGAEY